MASIIFKSGPQQEVHYSSQEALGDEPSAWTVALKPNAHDLYVKDLDEAGEMPSLVRTVKATGLAADVTADMWRRYYAVRNAIAAAGEDPVELWSTVERWSEWSAGKLAVHGAVETSPTIQRKWLLTELASQETSLKQQYGKNGALHPVALAMRNFMYGQDQLGSLNGSTPERELLPEVAYVNPVEIVGRIALDLAQESAVDI